MRIKLFIFVCYFILTQLKGQVNLIPNESFEFYTNCPTNTGQITESTPWVSPNTGTPDYFNSCNSPNSTIGIPNNAMGEQLPHTGTGYVGIYSYYDPNIFGSQANSREYLHIQLSSSLTSNKAYRIQFWASLSDSSQFAIKDLGAFFSTNPISIGNSNSLNLSPSIKSSIQNSDKTNWELIEGFYTAIGGETYLTIGNFFDSNNTNSIFLGTGPYACSYYYIDDVSVIDSSAIGINEINNNYNINVYPNPSNGNIQIDLSKLNESSDMQFVVYNTLGIEVKRQQITGAEITNIDLSDIANGTYLYKVFKDGKLYKYDKLVLIK